MDNRKKAWTGSGWSKGTGSGFRRKSEIGKVVGNQESAGFGMTGRTGAPVQDWHRFQGNKFPDPPPSHHICVNAV